MTHDFTGRTVVVTGAARGIGRATAEAFAAAGAHVALIGRSRDSLAPVEQALASRGLSASVAVCDLRRKAEVDAAVDATLAARGRIDVLVNNAGISGDMAPFLTLSEGDWDDMLAVNLKGAFLASQRVAQAMVAAGGGVILHNASIAGLGVDGPFSHYSAAKAGLLALSRSLAVELAPFGIRVNCVSPGYVRTDMTMQYFDGEAADGLTDFRRVPLRRLVEPREIAAAFLHLASDDASGTTGINLVVDGGLTANLYIMETLGKEV